MTIFPTRLRLLAPFLALAAAGACSGNAHRNERAEASPTVRYTHWLPEFASERAAHSACRDDSVVWLDEKTRAWVPSGHREYGAGGHGAFVCRIDAELAGTPELRSTQEH